MIMVKTIYYNDCKANRGKEEEMTKIASEVPQGIESRTQASNRDLRVQIREHKM